jgi:hypothetical protein
MTIAQQFIPVEVRAPTMSIILETDGHADVGAFLQHNSVHGRRKFSLALSIT